MAAPAETSGKKKKKNKAEKAEAVESNGHAASAPKAHHSPKSTPAHAPVIEDDGWEVVPAKKVLTHKSQDSSPTSPDAASSPKKEGSPQVEANISVGDAVGEIIGKKGATISKIQADSHARINVDKDTKVVNITGSQEAVDAATIKPFVQTVVNEFGFDRLVFEANWFFCNFQSDGPEKGMNGYGTWSALLVPAPANKPQRYM